MKLKISLSAPHVQEAKHTSPVIFKAKELLQPQAQVKKPKEWNTTTQGLPHWK